MYSNLSLNRFPPPAPLIAPEQLSGLQVLARLNAPTGEKSIDTSFVYEVKECYLTPEELLFFTEILGSTDIKRGVLPSGAEIFSAIEHHPDYYVGSAEERLLYDKKLKLLPEHAIVTELGPGDGGKAEIFFSQNHHTKSLRYQIIDTSHDFLEMTELRFSPFDRLRTISHCGDFFSAPKNFQRADVVMFLGTTISNFDKERGKHLLSEIKENYLANNGTLILGQDSNHNVDRLLRCYDDSGKHTTTFVMNALRAIKREYLPALDLNALSYHAFFDQENEAMRMGIRVIRDQTVESILGKISFAEGEFISVGESRKYSIASITEMALSAGFSSIETIPSELGVNIHIIK